MGALPDAHALLDVCGGHPLSQAHYKLLDTQPPHVSWLRVTHEGTHSVSYVLVITQQGFPPRTFAICFTLMTYFDSSVPGLIIFVHLAT
jgi:hypothetical protein